MSTPYLRQRHLLGKRFETVTCSNGKEFASHEYLSSKLSADWYFAHPYHSWEWGSCENANGLIRQYFPKGMDFGKLTQEDADRVMDKLNNRSRQCLGFETTNQVFSVLIHPLRLKLENRELFKAAIKGFFRYFYRVRSFIGVVFTANEYFFPKIAEFPSYITYGDVFPQSGRVC